jgi:pimeloyl-ACP methyl ester carboxylesterase
MGWLGSMAQRGARSVFLAGFFLGAFLVSFAHPARGQQPGAATPASLVGTWAGVLSPMAGIEFLLVFNIDALEGVLVATMDSPDQGVRGIPVAEIHAEGDRLILNVTAIAGRFHGLVSHPDTVEGRWDQGGQSFPLRLVRAEPGAAGRPRPQEPVPPFPYEEVEVRYLNPQAGIYLAGTLTMPPGDGPFPAVALITGSGPQDRDETILGHKPFWVLADHLTRQGVAVLRSDDRGVGASEGTFATATSEDFALDAAAAVAFLRENPRIDPDRVGLIGHSEGGLIAPLVVVQEETVAFQVLLAGPVLPGEEILHLQSAAIQRALGASAALIEANEALQRTLFALIRGEKDTPRLVGQLEAALREFVAGAPDALRAEMGIGSGSEQAWIQGQIQAVGSPWFRFFLTHDPRPSLREARVPTLSLFGELDLQVPPVENVEALETLWKDGAHPDLTVVVLPGLNHLFQTAVTGSPTEYGQIEETFAPIALEVIASWIRDRTGVGGEPLP